jgi:hypothetical protein
MEKSSMTRQCTACIAHDGPIQICENVDPFASEGMCPQLDGTRDKMKANHASFRSVLRYMQDAGVSYQEPPDMSRPLSDPWWVSEEAEHELGYMIRCVDTRSPKNMYFNYNGCGELRWLPIPKGQKKAIIYAREAFLDE